MPGISACPVLAGDVGRVVTLKPVGRLLQGQVEVRFHQASASARDRGASRLKAETPLPVARAAQRSADTHSMDDLTPNDSTRGDSLEDASNGSRKNAEDASTLDGRDVDAGSAAVPGSAAVRSPSPETGADAWSDPGEAASDAVEAMRDAGGNPNSPADLAHLADSSDRLLSELRELRNAEERKRRTTISTPEFHRLARDVEERALRVWSAASEERAESAELRTQPGVTTEDAEAVREERERANGDGKH